MKKLWFIGLTAAVLSFFGMAQATAAILCVEPTGAMGCFTTVQAAVDAAAPGDHIWVTPGVYYENVYVDTSTITIQGGEFTPARRRGVGGWAAVDPTRVIIDARPLCGNVAEAIWIDGAHHVTIANLTVRHADGWDNIYSDGDFTTIDRVHSLSSTLSGVYIVADDATVRNCYITANLYAGVEIYGDNASVTNNAIYNHYYEGVYIEGLAPDVIGNRIDQTEDDGVYLYDADGAVVSQNVIRGAYGYGVYTDDTIECTIANNDIRSCYDGGIYMYYSDDSTVSGNYISEIGRAHV